MTIRRQYILPNCSLVLEGLSLDPTSTVLSILANAECTIVGIEQPLSGGLEFFKSLVEAVSQYSQGLLSGLPHSKKTRTQPTLVQIQLDPEGPYHHLQVQTAALEESPDVADPTALTDIKLSTVQLFDLAEAIDQFFSDSQTLPDLKPDLAPLPRRYVKPSEPLAQRATPPLLGAGALVIAAIGCFFLPVPELQRVEPTAENSAAEAITPGVDNSTTPSEPATEAAVTEADATTDQPSTTGTPENTEDPEALPKIEDDAQIAALQTQLTDQLEAAITGGTTFPDILTYRVSVADNGDIIGYRHEDAVSLANIDRTPLPKLTYIPLEGTAPAANRIAQYQVQFSPDGAVSISPWSANSAESSSAASENESSEDESLDDNRATDQTQTFGTASEAKGSSSTKRFEADGALGTLPEAIENEIQEQAEISALNSQLRQTIVRNQAQSDFDDTLSYRVRVAENGNVVGYEAENETSAQLAEQIALPDLVKVVDDNTPQVDFRVVMQPDGVIEVSPWRGWR